MHKKLLIIFCLLIFCGCSKNNNNVNTIIEKKSNYVIGINYPISNTILDKKIKEDINSIYNNFKEKYSNGEDNELNIDYSFTEINNYISITIYIYINENTNIVTYNFNRKNNKILNINDVVSEEIVDEFGNFDYFSFDNKKITIYKNNIGYDIPINDVNLKIDLNNEVRTKKVDVKIPTKIIDPNSKVIALTFDDGPSIYTNELIEYLKKMDCNSTFFILGNKVKLYKDTLIKSINYGNELGNHSYNHKWLIKLDDESFKEQITKTQDIINEYLNYTPVLLRPTYGSINNNIKKNTDLKITLWNVDTLDWKYKNIDKIVYRATKKLKDGNIILMHDTHKRTIEAIKKIVPIIKKQGYKCVTISEMNEIKLIREKMNG